jgi:hypothetical protein
LVIYPVKQKLQLRANRFSNLTRRKTLERIAPMRKLLGKLGGTIPGPFPHAVTLFLLILTAFFFAVPETGNAQVWVSSGFKAGSDAQHMTAYCSTSAVNPVTGETSPTAADYWLFTTACMVTASTGATFTNQNCYYGEDFEPSQAYLGNPTGICTIDFQPVPGVEYTINSGHWLWFIDMGWGISNCNSIPTYNDISTVCFSDPEGFFAYPPKSTPNYSTQSASITREETGITTGTGLPQLFDEFAIVPLAEYGPDGVQLATTSSQYPGCSTPTITSVSPSTWLAGNTYAITLTGTGFTTSADATSACPESPLAITTPSGTEVAISNVTVASSTQITATVTPPSNEQTETATLTVGTTPDTASTTAEILPACNLPTTETTAFQGWDTADSLPTVGLWSGTVTDTNGDVFSGYQVQEVDAGGGVDTCWWSGSKYTPQTALPVWIGGSVDINSENTWEYDHVGWIPSYVSYYRAQGKAPCGFTLYQQMQMQCLDNSWKNYGSVNTLKGSFTTTTVTSVRAGGTATRRY